MSIATAIELRDDVLNEQLWHSQILADRQEEERDRIASEQAWEALNLFEDFDNRIDCLLCSGSPEEIYVFIKALIKHGKGQPDAMESAQELLAKYLKEQAA